MTESDNCPSSTPLPVETAVYESVAPRGESASERIGPYRLLSLLGQGGMGEVWLAEQHEPIRRQVALKVIRVGLDTRAVIARFEVERQALALMDHPNIARVLDGGTTANGRPFFVMELVKGLPLTRFCDQERLTIRDRFELIIPVCHAVQHAHQKGVIHRDLKPSNILVGFHDRQPVPKVIDFGVAKATGPKLTDQTVNTAEGAFVGTLEYMAPEQAELTNLDIDTRADIYSLGVILYELLTGSPPFNRRELNSAAFGEILRLVREVQPSKPSTKLSTAAALPALAAARGSEPKHVTRLVRGDLDWIALKCLEKERGRRYATANDLAQDIQRYLNDEPVLAGPPSKVYRFRKFVRRHRGPVIAAGLLLLSLLGGIGGTSWGLVQAENAHSAEVAEREKAVANARRAVEERDRAERNLDAAHDLSIRLADVIEKTLPAMQGSELARRDLIRASAAAFQLFAEQRPDAPEIRRWNGQLNRYEGNIRRMLDDTGAAEKAYLVAIAALGSDEKNVDRLAETLRDYALLLARMGRLSDALAKLDAAAAQANRIQPTAAPAHARRRAIATIWLDRSGIELALGRFDSAAESAAQAITIFRELLADAAQGTNVYDQPLLAMALSAKAKAERERSDYETAYPDAKEASDLMKKVVTLRKPGVNQDDVWSIQAIVEYELSRTWLRNAKRDMRPLAESNLKAVADRLTDLARRHPNIASYEDRLARTLVTRGEIRAERGLAIEARADFDDARTRLERLTAQHPDIPEYRADLGRSFLGLAQLAGQDTESWRTRAVDALAAAAKASPDDIDVKKSLADARALK